MHDLKSVDNFMTSFIRLKLMPLRASSQVVDIYIYIYDKNETSEILNLLLQTINGL